MPSPPGLPNLPSDLPKPLRFCGAPSLPGRAGPPGLRGASPGPLRAGPPSRASGLPKPSRLDCGRSLSHFFRGLSSSRGLLRGLSSSQRFFRGASPSARAGRGLPSSQRLARGASPSSPRLGLSSFQRFARGASPSSRRLAFGLSSSQRLARGASPSSRAARGISSSRRFGRGLSSPRSGAPPRGPSVLRCFAGGRPPSGRDGPISGTPSRRCAVRPSSSTPSAPSAETRPGAAASATST